MNAAIIIPMRLGSTRLPRKGLLTIGSSSALALLVGRLRRQSRVGDKILLCTTREREDDVLVAAAKQLDLAVHRGSTDDVLLRLTEGAESVGVDWVAEVDGDDVLCDPTCLDAALTRAQATNADYFCFSGLPFGAAANVLSVSAMRRACESKSVNDTSTGIFAHITQNAQFRVVREHAEAIYAHPRARLTLDYTEDLTFFQAVVAAFPGREYEFTLLELLNLLHARPELVDINAGLNEAYWQHFNAHKSTIGGEHG